MSAVHVLARYVRVGVSSSPVIRADSVVGVFPRAFGDFRRWMFSGRSWTQETMKVVRGMTVSGEDCVVFGRDSVTQAASVHLCVEMRLCQEPLVAPCAPPRLTAEPPYPPWPPSARGHCPCATAAWRSDPPRQFLFLPATSKGKNVNAPCGVS